MGLRASHVFLSDHWLHEVRNENPSGREAQNCAGQAGDQNVKGAGVEWGAMGDPPISLFEPISNMGEF